MCYKYSKAAEAGKEILAKKTEKVKNHLGTKSLPKKSSKWKGKSPPKSD